jgi:hypothetical protein
MGLCLPRQCTATIIKNSLGKVMQTMQMPFNIYDVQGDIQRYRYP